MLFVKENGRHGFEFQPRQKKEKDAPAEAADASAAPTEGAAAPAEAPPRKRKGAGAAKSVRAPRKPPAASDKAGGRKAARRKT
jgi:hypothetical protein